MGWSAFAPNAGNVSIAISVTTTASSGVQCPSAIGTPETTSYIVSNTTSQGVFLAYGNAQVAAVIPTGAGTSAANGIWLGGNTTQSFNFGSDTYFSCIAPTGTSTVYITPGDGM